MKKYLSIIPATFLLLAVMMTSCLGDEIVQQEDKGLIIMSLNGTQTRAGNLFAGDEQVTKARIFVFVNETLEKNQLFTSGEATFTNPFVLSVATGNKDVYVLANETATLANQLAAVTTKIGLKALLADEIGSPLAPPVVMAGEALGVEVVETPSGTQNKADVTLTRVAAKISLTFKKETDAAVKITKVSLLKNTGKTPLWEGGAAISGQTYWSFVKNYATPFDLANNTTTLTLDPVFVYENITEGEKTNASQLEVEALYNNIPTKYRVYINENVSAVVNPGDPASSVTTPADHLYSIKRNHEYKLTGIIKNIGEFDGFTLSTYVLPWNLLQSQVLFDWVYTITPQPTTTNYTYTAANPTDLVTFTFKLDNPAGATWMAQLSNPLDFEFSAAGGAVSTGGLGVEYTVSVKPRNTQGTTARTTEFYISVNGTEIPLLQGSILVGAGNRVVINQPATP